MIECDYGCEQCSDLMCLGRSYLIFEINLKPGRSTPKLKFGRCRGLAYPQGKSRRSRVTISLFYETKDIEHTLLPSKAMSVVNSEPTALQIPKSSLSLMVDDVSLSDKHQILDRNQLLLNVPSFRLKNIGRVIIGFTKLLLPKGSF